MTALALYTPLQRDRIQIRLALFATHESFAQQDGVVGELLTFNLEDAPAYRALSYAWGDGGDEETIQLDGHKVQVGKNLYEFLQIYTRQEDHGLIWIDQLSINQADIEERNT